MKKTKINVIVFGQSLMKVKSWNENTLLATSVQLVKGKKWQHWKWNKAKTFVEWFDIQKLILIQFNDIPDIV